MLLTFREAKHLQHRTLDLRTVYFDRHIGEPDADVTEPGFCRDPPHSREIRRRLRRSELREVAVEERPERGGWIGEGWGIPTHEEPLRPVHVPGRRQGEIAGWPWKRRHIMDRVARSPRPTDWVAGGRHLDDGPVQGQGRVRVSEQVRKGTHLDQPRLKGQTLVLPAQLGPVGRLRQ
jgi:hypothetical protein